MSILVRFSPPSLTAEQYDESVRRLQEAGHFPPEGMEYHVCFGSDENLRVSEIWDSREQWQAFGEKLMPLLAEVGIEPGEPEVMESATPFAASPSGNSRRRSSGPESVPTRREPLRPFSRPKATLAPANMTGATSSLYTPHSYPGTRRGTRRATS